MPKNNMDFSEEDIIALVANAVREEHKLPKDHEVKVLVIIDRDEAGENPVVTVHAEFEKPVEAKGAKGAKK